MSSIVDLSVLGFVELGASSKFRVWFPNSSKINHFSCFYNPNIKMPPKSQNRPSNACLPSYFHRDCAMRLRVKATTKDDDLGESSSDAEDLNLWADMSPLHPHYVEYGLIYYNVLVLSCQITWMLNFNSQIPKWAKKDSVSFFQRIIKRFCISDVRTLKATNHNKVAELFLKQKCRSHPYIVSVFEYLPFTQQAEFINDLAQALMLVEAIKIVEFDVLSNMSEEICDLILVDDDYAPNIANSTTTSKFTVANCAFELNRELNTISKVESKLMGQFKLADDITNYLDHVEDEVVARGRWPKLFHKCRVSVFETNDCITELRNALQEINMSMRPFGKLICECMTCYDFKKQQMNKQKTSTTQIDDFQNIQENLRLADQSLSELLPHPNLLYYSHQISTDYVSMRDIFLGFRHSLIAYRSIWRGMRIFDKKMNEARQEGKVTHGSMRRKAISQKLTHMG